MRLFLSYFIGLIFGLGIVISGMANPSKVLNFFDVAGTWDPSLAFVMGGALIVTFIGYRIVFRRQEPLLGQTFFVPAPKAIDTRLVAGSAVFGIGWGIAGFCPGGALPAIGTGDGRVLMFVGALVAGIFAARFLSRILETRGQPVTA